MNKLSTAIAAALLIATGVASAQTTDAKPLTREQVIAELVAARDSGELDLLRSEKGIDVVSPNKAAAVATSKLPRQAVLTVRPTELREPVVADHGENAARELGDFPAPVTRRATALAGR